MSLEKLNLEAFQMEVDKPEDGGSNTFVTIAKAQVYFCWQGWTNGQSELFEYRAGNNESSDVARNHCQNYIESGVNNYEQWPQNGICTKIFGDWVPTNAEGKFSWGNIYDFVKKYESNKNSHKLAEDEQQKVTGPMPFNLVVEGIKTNPSVFEQEQYVKMSQEINQWAKAKGKTNKKGYDLRVHVIQHVYKSKAEASVEVKAINASAGQDVSQSQPNIQLSDRAFETWGEGGALSKEEILKTMKTQKGNIETFIEKALNGIGMDKMSLPDAQVFVANNHGMEQSDLPLIGIGILEESPVEQPITQDEILF